MRESGKNTAYDSPNNLGFSRRHTVSNDIARIAVERIRIITWILSGESRYLYGADLPITNILPIALGRD